MPAPQDFEGWTYRRLAEWASRKSDHELNRLFHRDSPLASLRPIVRKALTMFYDERARLSLGTRYREK